jgi:hypothetical protein
MALFGQPDVGFVLLGGRSIAGYLTEIQDSHEAMVKETTGLGDSDDNWAAVGMNKADVKLLGIYNSTDFIAAVEVNTTQELMYSLEGNTINNEGTGIDGVKGTLVRNAVKEEFHRIEVDFKAANKLDRGKVMADHVSRNASTAVTTTVDNAGSSANGAVGYLGVSALALGGYTNLAVKIRDSTDDISFADLITFAVVTAAPASERATVAGTVNRYSHTTIAFGGSGSSESATYAVIMRRL